MTKETPQALSDAFADRIRLQRIRVFFGHAAGNMASVGIGGIFLLLVLGEGGAASGAMAIWAFALAAGATSVWLFERSVARIGLIATNCVAMYRRRMLLGGLVGLLYGVAGFLMPWADAPVPDTFLLLVMTTLVMLSALGYATMPSFTLMLCVVAFVPLLVRYGIVFARTGDRYYALLIASVVVWVALTLAKVMRISRTVIASVELNERLQGEIREHERTRESIRHMALHDALTGLANRRHFDETITRMLRVAARDKSRLGLLVIDLNDFKPVNDTHGHAMGDRLLQLVAQRLTGTLRAADFAARIGGDEFAVVLSSLDSVESEQGVALKLAEALARTVVIDGVELRVGASIGWAMFPQDGEDEDTLLRVADRRMYEVKAEHKQVVKALS